MIPKQAENYFKSKMFNQSSGGIVKMIVRGNSMWPFLRHEQIILARKLAKNEDINIGDIVVIKNENFLLIHRVLLKRKSKGGKGYEYFTKGDRRLVGDGWVDAKNIVGLAPSGKTKRIFNCLTACYSIGLILIGKIIKRSNA
jgi:signal peptidase I